MPQVSVLTAVYNSEKYLRTCLDSLLAQTLSDAEFICIDDGSTDSSLSILQAYAQKDSRFRILHFEENRGMAIARNEALTVATGKYIAMLDSDDWFSPDTLALAVEAIETTPQADCAVMRLILHYDDKGTTEEYPIKTHKKQLTGFEAFRMSLDWSLHGLYLVRTSIHQAYPFDTSCRLYSDDNTTRLHYLHSRRVVMSAAEYHYRKHPESLTTVVSPLRFLYMDANLSMKRQIQAEAQAGNLGTQAEDTLNFYENHRWLNIVGCYWYYYNHQSHFSHEEQQQIEQKFQNMLSTIEKKRIRPSLKYKLGYYPFKSYQTFVRMENFYFKLRKLLKNESAQ